ncbi:hypothetical protein M0R19_02545 [Candidatus Pacearchaeota archaeon]|nr:hypothetical protein [Candidatus Pacearchaeota archaeon]
MENKKIHVEIIKILIIIMIPLLLIEFVIYANIKQQNFDYVYDIGSTNDNYLSPANRISDKLDDSGINYRNLTDQLVYFDIPAIKGTDKIDLQIKFKDNFPINSNLIIGAKDKEEWHYKSITIYDKTIEELMKKYPYSQRNNLKLIKLNKYSEDYTIDEFQTAPPSVKLATNQNITIPELKIEDYSSNSFTIDTALRDSLTFYVYIKGSFNLEVWKRDLNMYTEDEKGKDVLNISLYDLKNKLIASEKIKDDGIEDKKTNKNNTNDQKGELQTGELKEGVYKLELKNNGDMLVTKIKLNQNKIVLRGSVFLAQSGAYFDNFEETSKVYFKTQKYLTLTTQTWHTYALQTIKINGDELNISKISTGYTTIAEPSDDFYQIKSEKNDIKISGPEFFSFTEDSWFNPFAGKNVQYKSDLRYLEQNADYVLVDYISPKEENGWKIASISLNVEKDNLYIKNDKLNIMFNTAHLNQNKNDTKTKYIPIDWINITTHKKGLFEQ